MFAGIIHQDLPHKLRCHSEKVFPILKLNRTFDQSEIGFVYDRGALQRVIETLPPQVVVCHAAKLLVDQRHQQVKRGLVALSPLPQQLGNLVGRGVRQGLAPSLLTLTRRSSRPYPNFGPKSTP